MDLQKLLGKTAADKNSKKLGKIIKIEDIQDKKTKISKKHVVILVKKFLRTDITVLVEAEKLIKSDYSYVWFDITKEDFEQEVRETRALMYLYSG